ncbi:hypothetical protein L9F63_003741, partial [Diploptera punctata]
KKVIELKIPILNATKHAAEATGKSEATICKIGKESKTISNDEKLKSPGKNRTNSSRKIVIDEFDK